MYLLLTALIIFLLASCNKQNNTSHLAIRMTDSPGKFDAVLVDVQSSEVTGSAGGAVTLNTKAGIYNLLDFTGGFDTLIASGDIAAGTISQIRLILG